MTVDPRKFPFDFMECVDPSGKFLAVAEDGRSKILITLHSASAQANGQIEYIGLSSPGASISASAWAIKRVQYDASGNATAVVWAQGTNAKSFMFDDRTTYTYS